VFLHSITCFSNKKINKHFDIILDNIDDVISLSNLLDFDLIKNYLKLHIFPYINRMILDITFKFIAELNM
jgi:hypothetical protein